MPDTSVCKKGHVIALHQNDISNRQIAIQLRMCKGTVDGIVKRFNEEENVDTHRNRSGRKKKTRRMDRSIIKLSKDDPRASSSVLANQMRVLHGVNLSSSCIRRRLLTMGRRAYRPQKSPVLTPAMRAKRVEWARRYAL